MTGYQRVEVLNTSQSRALAPSLARDEAATSIYHQNSTKSLFSLDRFKHNGTDYLNRHRVYIKIDDRNRYISLSVGRGIP